MSLLLNGIPTGLSSYVAKSLKLFDCNLESLEWLKVGLVLIWQISQRLSPDFLNGLV